MAKIKFTGLDQMQAAQAAAAAVVGERTHLLIVPAEGATWLLTGDDAPPPPEVPTVLSSRKFWLAALELGYKAGIDAMVAGMDERQKITVEKATEFDRTSPVFLGFATALGVSEAEILALFDFADKLP